MATRNGAAVPRQFNLWGFNVPIFREDRADMILREMGAKYRAGTGIYSGVKKIQPQWLYTPQFLIDEGRRSLANFFFFLALSQRGGLNSDDSIRLTRAIWETHPELFDPLRVSEMSPRHIMAMITGVAERFYPSMRGEKRGGSLSFKLGEFSDHWWKNGRILETQWGGDIRSVFSRKKTFEEFFCSVSREAKENPNSGLGFYGMRRKIFSLLAFWLIEFGLVDEFKIPLVVDFHVMRALTELDVITPWWRPLGPGKPLIQARRRPRPLWGYPYARAVEQFVNHIVAWSYGFMAEHGLSPFDTHNGLWNLSRVMCARYCGNRSWSIKRYDPGEKKTHTITYRLQKSCELKAPEGWPKSYKDICRLCPFEKYCVRAVPAAPYYDWGILVTPGEHVKYPARTQHLSDEWLDLPGSVTRRQNNFVKAPSDRVGERGAGREVNAEQLMLIK